MKRAVERLVPGFDEGYRARDWTSVLTSTGDFLDSVEISVRHVVLMEAERYLNLWRSHNLLNAAAGPEGMAQSGRRTGPDHKLVAWPLWGLAGTLALVGLHDGSCGLSSGRSA